MTTLNLPFSKTLILQIGGTTTDVGVVCIYHLYLFGQLNDFEQLLPSGFPRQAAAFIKVGGVRTKLVQFITGIMS